MQPVVAALFDPNKTPDRCEWERKRGRHLGPVQPASRSVWRSQASTGVDLIYGLAVAQCVQLVGVNPIETRSRTGQRRCPLHQPAAAGNAWDTANMSPDGQGGTGLCFKKVIYALIGLEASLFQALVCLSQWPYLLMH